MHPDADPLAHPPWMDITVFPIPPLPLTYGYYKDAVSHQCTQAALVEHIQCDSNKKISLVWTPDFPHLLPPEDVPWLFDAVRMREYKHLKRAQSHAIMHMILWGTMVIFASIRGYSTQLPFFMAVALGLFPFIEHSWDRYRLRSYNPETGTQQITAARYNAWVGRLPPRWTLALVLCILCIGMVQFVLDLWSFFAATPTTIAAAGIVKPAIRAGEWWRLLTGTFVHIGLAHLLFNIAALFALGQIIEITFHRAYVPIVFVLSALSGSLWSLFLLPNATSAGASGGIMGLLGFALVLVWLHRQRFPYPIRRDLLVIAIYIVIIGLFAAQIIDNPAHIGGGVTGALVGGVLARYHRVRIPDQPPRLVVYSSIIANGVIFATTIWVLLLIIGI